MNRLTPITPGVLLDQEFLQPLGIIQYWLAKAIGVPASQISPLKSECFEKHLASVLLDQAGWRAELIGRWVSIVLVSLISE